MPLTGWVQRGKCLPEPKMAELAGSGKQQHFIMAAPWDFQKNLGRKSEKLTVAM